MKIVVLDGYTENPGDLSWAVLEQMGELQVYDRTSLTDEAEIIARIGDAEAVYTNKTPITKRVIDACPDMKFISVLATGYNVVDYEYAREKGIPERRLWGSLPSPCCWRSATMWRTIPRRCMRGGGSAATTGASGITR